MALEPGVGARGWSRRFEPEVGTRGWNQGQEPGVGNRVWVGARDSPPQAFHIYQSIETVIPRSNPPDKAGPTPDSPSSQPSKPPTPGSTRPTGAAHPPVRSNPQVIIVECRVPNLTT